MKFSLKDYFFRDALYKEGNEIKGVVISKSGSTEQWTVGVDAYQKARDSILADTSNHKRLLSKFMMMALSTFPILLISIIALISYWSAIKPPYEGVDFYIVKYSPADFLFYLKVTIQCWLCATIICSILFLTISPHYVCLLKDRLLNEASIDDRDLYYVGGFPRDVLRALS